MYLMASRWKGIVLIRSISILKGYVKIAKLFALKDFELQKK